MFHIFGGYIFGVARQLRALKGHYFFKTSHKSAYPAKSQLAEYRDYSRLAYITTV